MKPDKPQALLFIDGYNIVGAWTDLKKIRDRHGLEEARHRLVDHLTGFSAYNAYNTKVVFDSQYRDGGSTEQVITEFLAIHYNNPLFKLTNVLAKVRTGFLDKRVKIGRAHV